MNDEYLTTKQVSQPLGRSKQSVRVRLHQLPHFQLDGHLRFRKSEVQAVQSLLERQGCVPIQIQGGKDGVGFNAILQSAHRHHRKEGVVELTYRIEEE